MACGGPYTCAFPRPEDASAGDLWTCPNCFAEYRLSPPKAAVFWRNWFAPHGRWRLTLASRLGWNRAHPGHPMHRREEL